MELKSTVFENNSSIPTKYACDGEKINPPLEFTDVPPGTKSLVLVMEDPDVPRAFRPDGMFDHWVVWNIPAMAKGIPENSIPDGVVGQNTLGTLEYVPPCPPDKEHRYYFYLYAIDTMLQLPKTSGKTDVMKAVRGHIIAKAELMGRYNRKKNVR